MKIRTTFITGKVSVACVIPKEFGIKKGTTMIVSKRGNKIILEPLIK